MYYLVFWNEISFCKSIDKNMKLCVVVRLKTSMILVFSIKKKSFRRSSGPFHLEEATAGIVEICKGNCSLISKLSKSIKCCCRFQDTRFS